MDTVTTDPGRGEPGLGEPGLGDPGLGEPGLGEPGLGEPASGDPATVAEQVALRRLGRPRDEARETAILDAALALIAEVGYDRVTMDGIAARARSSKATIYRRWPSKGALVATAVRCRAGEHLELPDTGTLRTDLLGTLEAMVQHISQEDLGLMTGIFAALRTDPDLAAACREQLFAEKRSLIAPLFDRAAARGEQVRADAPDLFSEIAAPIVMHRLLFDDQPADATYCAHVVDDVLLPVCTSSAPPAPRTRKDHP